MCCGWPWWTGLDFAVDLERLQIVVEPIGDQSPVSHLGNLSWLTLLDIGVRDLASVARLSRLTRLHLWNNMISDLGPLVENGGLSAGDSVVLFEIPLNEASVGTHVPELRARGVAVQDIVVEVTDASAPGGQPLDFKVRLSGPAKEAVQVNYEAYPGGLVTERADYFVGVAGQVTIPAGSTVGSISVQTYEDDYAEPHEPLRRLPFGVVWSPVRGLDWRSAPVPTGKTATGGGQETMSGCPPALRAMVDVCIAAPGFPRLMEENA